MKIEALKAHILKILLKLGFEIFNNKDIWRITKFPSKKLNKTNSIIGCIVLCL